MLPAKLTKFGFIILLFLFIGHFLSGCDESGSSGSSGDKSNLGVESVTWYKDSDGDGFGTPGTSITQQSQPLDYVSNSDDCNDYNPEIYPGAQEECDGWDNDCDGKVDEGTCELKQIKITGSIQNINAAENYITEDARLQLMAMPADGDLDWRTDKLGRLVCVSELAVIEIPPNDFFKFEILNLLPGEYVVAVQNLELSSADPALEPILSYSDNEFAKVEIPEEYTSPLLIELGDVIIPLSTSLTDVNKQGLQGSDAPPAAPGVWASDGSYPDRIHIEWNVSAAATSYEVYRSVSYMGDKQKITTTAGTDYNDTSVPCGDSYYYWVKARNSFGTSNFLYTDLGYRSCRPPKAPTKLSASDGAYETVRLSWNGVAEAISYAVYRAASPGDDRTLVSLVNSVNFEDTSAVCPNSYCYWVKSRNAAGESPFSNYDWGKPACPDTMDADEKTTQSEEKGANEIGAIPTPSGLTASDGSFADKIHLKWRASENATTYEVYRAQTFCGDKTKIGSTAATDFNDKSVPDKLVYYYWVKAINKELGTSEFSNYDTGFLMRAPDAPTGVKASDGTYLNKILISWNAVPVASYYEVYRAEWSGAAKTKLGTTSKTSFYDAGVECSTCCPDDYAYFVKAANDAGISAFSDYDSGYVYKTLRDPDATATDGLDCCVFVKWETVGGAKSYRIYRASSLDGPKMIVDTRSAGDACRRYVFRDTTVTCPKVYYYWVKALDGRGYTSCIYGAPDSGYCGNCAGD